MTSSTPPRGASAASVPAELRLTHLQQLEAEAIHIIREVVARFERPVMLYSIGKDSSELLHLARKAFHPGRIPFPLLHVDTTWKFREMIAFRNRMADEIGFELVVHTNQDGVAQGINPFDHGSKNYTDIMKTQALKQALTAGGYDAAFGGARRDEEFGAGGPGDRLRPGRVDGGEEEGGLLLIGSPTSTFVADAPT